MPDETPRMKRPKRIATLRLSPPYDVYTVRAWINLSPPVFADITSGDSARFARAIQELIVEHDLTDFDGESLPPAGDPGLAAAMDQDVFQAIWQARLAEVGRLDPPSAKS